MILCLTANSTQYDFFQSKHYGIKYHEALSFSPCLPVLGLSSQINYCIVLCLFRIAQAGLGGLLVAVQTKVLGKGARHFLFAYYVTQKAARSPSEEGKVWL